MAMLTFVAGNELVNQCHTLAVSFCETEIVGC